MNNKNYSKQQLDEGVVFWTTLLGVKVLKFLGFAGGGYFSYKMVKKLIGGSGSSGGIKSLMAKLRDKKYLRQQGLTDDEIKLLWAKNGKNLNDLAEKIADSTIELLKQGQITPEEALKMYSGYIPPGEAAATLQRFKQLYKKSASTVTNKATTSTVSSTLKFKAVPRTNMPPEDEFKKVYQSIFGMETPQVIRSKWLHWQNAVASGKVVIPSGNMPTFEEFTKFMNTTSGNKDTWAKKNLTQRMLWYKDIQLMHKLFH